MKSFIRVVLVSASNTWVHFSANGRSGRRVLTRAFKEVALDFVELDPLPGQQQGREGLKQVIAAFRTAFPDIHWVIEEMVREGI